MKVLAKAMARFAATGHTTIQFIQRCDCDDWRETRPKWQHGITG